MRLFLQARVFCRNSVLAFRRVSYIKVSFVIFLISIQKIIIFIFAYKTNANISVTYVIPRNYVLDRICQEIRNMLYVPKINLLVNKSRTPVLILGHKNLMHFPTSYFLHINYNIIIIPSNTRSFIYSFSFCFFFWQSIVQVSHFYNTCYMLR